MVSHDFYCRAGQASSVKLLGRFDGGSLNEIAMKPIGGGVWHARIAMERGFYRIGYSRDGRCHGDASCAGLGARVPVGGLAMIESVLFKEHWIG